MAEQKMFKAGGALKRIPKWAWYVSGGVLIAGGYMYFRNRGETVPIADDQGVIEDGDVTQAPAMIVPPTEVIGGGGELNTDIPTQTLGLLGELFAGSMLAIQESYKDAYEAYLALLAQGGGGPAPQQGAPPDAGGFVTVPPPTPPPPAPAPPPPPPRPKGCAALEGGYHCGNTITDGNIRKGFSGAIGWARIASGGSGKDHWIDYHVRFCSRLERWRIFPNKSGDPSSKIWQGDRPNIC